jgi:multidrug efflux pump subunit AcrB
MSTTTSVFGMLPLLLVPGSGSELYRGMAAVIVGGMLVSTLFTLLLLPSLLRMNEERSAVIHATPETI